MFEKEKIQEAYENSIVFSNTSSSNMNESAEMAVKSAIEKVFPVKVKKMDIKRKIIFHLSAFVDEEEFDNFAKIDAVQEFIKKKYKGSIVNFKGRTIELEEL